MKRLVVLMSVASILLLSSTAFAVGIGFFIDGSTGSGEAEWDSDFDSWDIDSSTVAGGTRLRQMRELSIIVLMSESEGKSLKTKTMLTWIPSAFMSRISSASL
jgi:hypothetical protein